MRSRVPQPGGGCLLHPWPLLDVQRSFPAWPHTYTQSLFPPKGWVVIHVLGGPGADLSNCLSVGGRAPSSGLTLCRVSRPSSSWCGPSLEGSPPPGGREPRARESDTPGFPSLRSICALWDLGLRVCLVRGAQDTS